jgi:hypothetical protein
MLKNIWRVHECVYLYEYKRLAETYSNYKFWHNLCMTYENMCPKLGEWGVLPEIFSFQLVRHDQLVNLESPRKEF